MPIPLKDMDIQKCRHIETLILRPAEGIGIVRNPAIKVSRVDRLARGPAADIPAGRCTETRS